MNESPRLNNAMEKIYDVLREYNIGAVIVLHTPGYVKVAQRLDPAYSCIQQVGGEIKFRVDLQRDFGNNKAALEERLTDTLDMMEGLAKAGALVILPIGEKVNVMKNIINKYTEPGGDIPPLGSAQKN